MSDVTVHPVPPPEAGEPTSIGAPSDGGGRRRLRGRRGAQLAVISALLLGAAGAIGLLALTRHDRVRVPTVVGRDGATAARLIRGAGLKVRLQQLRSPKPSGLVVGQAPGPRARADKHSTVVLRVSTGPGLTTIPRVRGQSPAGAEQALRAAGLTFAERRQPASVPAGQVASLTPPATSQVSRGTEVTVVVSSGPDRVEVPRVLGLREAAAQRRVARAGFQVVIVREESSQPAGQVIAQRPQAGKRRRRGAAARIVVAAAPPPVSVPSVSGLDLESAVTTLSGLGLRIEFRDRAPGRGQRAGTILTQDPPARSSVPRGGTITLTVAGR